MEEIAMTVAMPELQRVLSGQSHQTEQVSHEEVSAFAEPSQGEEQKEERPVRQMLDQAEITRRAIAAMAASQEEAKAASGEFLVCGELLECGHFCKGVAGEGRCIPCMHPDCTFEKQEIQSVLLATATSEEEKREIRQMVQAVPSEEEQCSICYTSTLEEGANLLLACGHVFHAECVANQLRARHPTLRINFGYLSCPQCKADIFMEYYVPVVGDLLQQEIYLREEIMEKAVEEGMKEGLHADGTIDDWQSEFYGRLGDYCMKKCAFYECFKCKGRYFGGMQDCAEALDVENSMTTEQLRCPRCAREEMGIDKRVCEQHGNEFLDFKCMFCCSVAMFVCGGGGQYYCQRCHNDAMDGGKHRPQTSCEGGEQCSLGLAWHPRASNDVHASSFALGCSICRSNNLERIEQREGDSGFNFETRQNYKNKYDHVLGHAMAREVQVVRGSENRDLAILDPAQGNGEEE